MTGAARQAQETSEQAEALARKQEIEHKQNELDRKRKSLELQLDALQATFAAEEEELRRIIEQSKLREGRLTDDRRDMERLRQVEENSDRKARRHTDGVKRENNENKQKDSGKETSAKRI